MSLDAILTHPRLKLFLALSRTPHGVIDIATPALAALLCLGHFPPLVTTLLGVITVFSGYTAVYALNDLVDYRTDREKSAWADTGTVKIILTACWFATRWPRGC